jgi:transaldolase
MVKIFADGADRASILELNKNPFVEGFTTNPSLLRKAGVTDYKEFALDILSVIRDKPISFEVIADDNYEMYRQALEIASWGENVYVKIPITNTEGKSTEDVIRRLDHVNLNVTAITTIKQVRRILPSLKKGFISIFAGRIADTGINPLPIMKSALKLINGTKIELIWASPREVFNVYQAQEIGCHVITCTPDLIKKMSLQGKDLTEYSLDTVRMFYNDAKESGLKL